MKCLHQDRARRFGIESSYLQVHETVDELWLMIMRESLRNGIGFVRRSSVPYNPSNDTRWNLDCNEVYPNLLISNAEAAKNKEYLKAVGVTHILNAAEGDHSRSMVNTSKEYYEGTGIKYYGLQLEDVPTIPVSIYFHSAASFIDEGLSSGGKVLVHCQMGLSRSSTCVIAYLMIKKNMSIKEAVLQVLRHRQILPNFGFVCQLAQLDLQLQSIRTTW